MGKNHKKNRTNVGNKFNKVARPRAFEVSLPPERLKRSNMVSLTDTLSQEQKQVLKNTIIHRVIENNDKTGQTVTHEREESRSNTASLIGKRSQTKMVAIIDSIAALEEKSNATLIEESPVLGKMLLDMDDKLVEMEALYPRWREDVKTTLTNCWDFYGGVAFLFLTWSEIILSGVSICNDRVADVVRIKLVYNTCRPKYVPPDDATYTLLRYDRIRSIATVRLTVPMGGGNPDFTTLVDIDGACAVFVGCIDANIRERMVSTARIIGNQAIREQKTQNRAIENMLQHGAVDVTDVVGSQLCSGLCDV